MRERELHRIWEFRLYRSERLLTEDARTVEVVFPGIRNVEAGPDFRGARLRIGGVPLAGDVELHLTTDGWRGHSHDRDGAYDSVVLHVAMDRSRNSARIGIAELVLGPYLDPGLEAASPERQVSPKELERLGDLRFDRRVSRLRYRLARESLPPLFYREILIGLGYKSNQAGFAELARLVPWGTLHGLDAAAIERRFLAAARAISWRLRGVRPANHPLRRIESAARWLAAVGTGALHEIHFARPTDTPFDRKIGVERSRDLVTNVVLPMSVAAGTPEQAAEARRLFCAMSAGSGNRRMRDARAIFGIRAVATLRQEWGLLELVGKFGLEPRGESVINFSTGGVRERDERDPGAV